MDLLVSLIIRWLLARNPSIPGNDEAAARLRGNQRRGFGARHFSSPVNRSREGVARWDKCEMRTMAIAGCPSEPQGGGTVGDESGSYGERNGSQVNKRVAGFLERGKVRK